MEAERKEVRKIDLNDFHHEKVTLTPNKPGQILIKINGRSEGCIYKRREGISWVRHGRTIRLFTQDDFEGQIEKVISGVKVEDSEDKSNKAEEVKVEVKVEPRIKTDFVESNKEVKKMEYAIEKKKNVLLKGPTGCGKSFLIDEMAKHHGKVLHVINCDVELDKSELIGHYIIKESDSGVVSEWIPGLIPTAMENGDWVVFDELNMSRAEVLSSMNQAMDYRRRITIKEHANEVIEAHEDFRMFACINPEYAGTCELNYAFRRRFNNIIDIDYLPESKEIKLLVDRTGLDKERAEKLVKIANDTRRLEKSGKLEHSVSTAHLLEFAEMLKDGKFSAVDCAKITINLTDDFGEQEDIINIVKNYFY